MAIGHEDGCAYGLGKKCDCKGVPPVAPTPPDSRPTRPDLDAGRDKVVLVDGLIHSDFCSSKDKHHNLCKMAGEALDAYDAAVAYARNLEAERVEIAKLLRLAGRFVGNSPLEGSFPIEIACINMAERLEAPEERKDP